jgi:hypothetical protein
VSKESLDDGVVSETLRIKCGDFERQFTIQAIDECESATLEMATVESLRTPIGYSLQTPGYTMPHLKSKNGKIAKRCEETLSVTHEAVDQRLGDLLEVVTPDTWTVYTDRVIKAKKEVSRIYGTHSVAELREMTLLNNW